MTEFRSGRWSAIWIYAKNLHPLLNVFSQFDWQFKRLFRFAVIMTQICLITLICWGMYSKRIEEMTEENGWGDFRRVEDHKVFYTSLCLGLLTFPVSKSLMCCFRTVMYDTEGKPKKSSVKDNAKEVTDQWHKSNLAADTEGDITTSPGDEEREVHFIDMYLQLKLIFIISLFIFWMFTCFLSILYVVYSAQEAGEDTNPTQ